MDHRCPGASRRSFGIALATSLAVGLVGRPAAAQSPPASGPAPSGGPAPSAAVKARLAELRPKDFPSRPIELMVAFAPGGGMDVHARLLARYLQAYSDQNFIIVNKTGAAGFIGHAHLVSQVKPDGQTVGVLSSNFWADSILRAEGKWTHRDIEPIALYNLEPLGWVITTDGRHKDRGFADVIAQARQKPGEMRVSMSDSGATNFLVEQVEAATGTKFNRVAYQGGKQALTDLMGGHIDVSFGYMGEYRGMLLDGRVRPLAFTSTRRTPTLPEVPTFNELLRRDDVVWDAFRFAALPKGVPADRKAWLVALFDAVLDDPNLARDVTELGASVDRSLNTPARVTEEIERRVARERVFYDRKKAGG